MFYYLWKKFLNIEMYFVGLLICSFASNTHKRSDQQALRYPVHLRRSVQLTATVTLHKMLPPLQHNKHSKVTGFFFNLTCRLSDFVANSAFLIYQKIDDQHFYSYCETLVVDFSRNYCLQTFENYTIPPYKLEFFYIEDKRTRISQC